MEGINAKTLELINLCKKLDNFDYQESWKQEIAYDDIEKKLIKKEKVETHIHFNKKGNILRITFDTHQVAIDLLEQYEVLDNAIKEVFKLGHKMYIAITEYKIIKKYAKNP